MVMQDRELDSCITLALQASVPSRQKDAAWERLVQAADAQVLLTPLQELSIQSQSPPRPLRRFLWQLQQFLLVETMYQRAAASREAIPVSHFFSSHILVQFYPIHPLQLKAY